ncbi:MAG: hypothetical protein GC154_21900 [bacterium]|nr:hypothetical protein [bacterium]
MRTRAMFVWAVLALAVCGASWGQNRAGLLIQNSTGETISRCVEFTENSITVEELLKRSGFKLVTQESSFGAYVCYLHDDGVADCSNHPKGWFWNFFVHDGAGWTAANAGISSVTAEDGSLFGFGFGGWQEVELPETDFDQVCGTLNQAGLVIDHGDGTRVIRVVDFYGETLTGYQLLLKSGLDVVSHQYSFGAAVCAIDGEGHPEDNCFGDYTANDPSWGLSVLNERDEWKTAPVGVGDTLVYGGTVQGWYFAHYDDAQPPVTLDAVFGETSDVSAWDSLR